MNIKNFKRPEVKGTQNPGMSTPDLEKEVTNHQETQSTLEPEDIKKDNIQQYLDYLKEHEIEREDILGVLDSIVSTGNVYWSFDLFNKIPVTFQIRPAWVNNILVERMDKRPPKNFAMFSEIIGVYNLAGSLVKYNDNNFTLKDKEDFEKNKTFIQGLPFITQNHLIKKMAIFDRVVAVATSDWAIENFTKPQSEK